MSFCVAQCYSHICANSPYFACFLLDLRLEEEHVDHYIVYMKQTWTKCFNYHGNIHIHMTVFLRHDLLHDELDFTQTLRSAPEIETCLHSVNVSSSSNGVSFQDGVDLLQFRGRQCDVRTLQVFERTVLVTVDITGRQPVVDLSSIAEKRTMIQARAKHAARAH